MGLTVEFSHNSQKAAEYTCPFVSVKTSNENMRPTTTTTTYGNKKNMNTTTKVNNDVAARLSRLKRLTIRCSPVPILIVERNSESNGDMTTELLRHTNIECCLEAFRMEDLRKVCVDFVERCSIDNSSCGIEDGINACLKRE